MRAGVAFLDWLLSRLLYFPQPRISTEPHILYR